MSTGTDVIHRALQKIGAHSRVAPASDDSVVLGMEILNSMLESWLRQGIEIVYTPLSVPGDELNESVDTRNGIICNLALSAAPDFDNGKQVVSPELKIQARVGLAYIRDTYQNMDVPDKVVSSTLPVGAGNTIRNSRTFFPKGGVLDG